MGERSYRRPLAGRARDISTGSRRASFRDRPMAAVASRGGGPPGKRRGRRGARPHPVNTFPLKGLEAMT